MSERLASLLTRSAAVARLRERRAPIVLSEHALFAGTETHVIGSFRHARAYEVSPELELMRTGTDDVVELISGRGQTAFDAAQGASEEPAGGPQAVPPRGTGPFGIERRARGRPFPGEVDLWVDGGGLLDFVLVSDAPPSSDQIAVSKWRTLGLLLGPALSLTGLLYLAHAADQLRSQARF